MFGSVLLRARRSGRTRIKKGSLGCLLQRLAHQVASGAAYIDQINDRAFPAGDGWRQAAPLQSPILLVQQRNRRQIFD